MGRLNRVKPLHRTKIWRRFKKKATVAYLHCHGLRGRNLKMVVNTYLYDAARQLNSIVITRQIRITEIELITEDEASKESIYKNMWDSISSPDIYLNESPENRKTHTTVNSLMGYMAEMMNLGKPPS